MPSYFYRWMYVCTMYDGGGLGGGQAVSVDMVWYDVRACVNVRAWG